MAGTRASEEVLLAEHLAPPGESRTPRPDPLSTEVRLSMSQSLYEQLGGFSFVRKLVLDFYDRVLDEDDLIPFFQNTDMARLVDHQTKFWSTLLGGPASYDRDQLDVLHSSMGVEDQHFDLVLELAVETLEDHEVGSEHIESLTKAFESYRSAIVARNKADA
jgi:hemoglobin